MYYYCYCIRHCCHLHLNLFPKVCFFFIFSCRPFKIQTWQSEEVFSWFTPKNWSSCSLTSGWIWPFFKIYSAHKQANKIRSSKGFWQEWQIISSKCYRRSTHMFKKTVGCAGTVSFCCPWTHPLVFHISKQQKDFCSYDLPTSTWMHHYSAGSKRKVLQWQKKHHNLTKSNHYLFKKIIWI